MVCPVICLHPPPLTESQEFRSKLDALQESTSEKFDTLININKATSGWRPDWALTNKAEPYT